jgi:hypothetical protein
VLLFRLGVSFYLFFNFSFICFSAYPKLMQPGGKKERGRKSVRVWQGLPQKSFGGQVIPRCNHFNRPRSAMMQAMVKGFDTSHFIPQADEHKEVRHCFSCVTSFR